MSGGIVSDRTAASEAAGGDGVGLLQQLRQRKAGLVGLSGIAVLLIVAVAAPWLAPHDPASQDLGNVLLPPVWAGGELTYPFGTDAIGRDVLSRLIYGARSSVLISVCAMLLGGTLGVLTGLASGFYGRLVDTVLMRLGDIQLALPFILIAIVILGMMRDRSPIHLILVLGIPAWIVYARVVRSRVLSEREQAYVSAARSLGASNLRQMFRYVLPPASKVVPPIALIDLSHLVIMESTLSFLGFGLTSPSISWGQILADGRQNMIASPWLPVLPGLAIMLTVLTINLAVEGLRDDGTPRRRRRRSDRKAADADRAAAPARLPGREVSIDGGAGGDRDGDGDPRASADDVQGRDGDGDGDLGVRRNGGGGGQAQPLLAVEDLEVEFDTPTGVVEAVRGVSFTVERGRILGIVGESGSGKSVTSFAIMGLLGEQGHVTGGSITFDGTDLTRAPEAVMRGIRGPRIGMMFQNPVGSLNPVLTVGYQIVETLRVNRGMDRATARQVAEEAFGTVGFPDPRHVMRQYPFRLSGGQNQRVMIAMTMALGPDLLLADEPTTALDVTTQAEVIDQLLQVREEHGTGIVLISHDIGLIGEVADEVVVMYAGQVCERGPTETVLNDPGHPYTRALLGAVPQPGAPEAQLAAIPGELPSAQQPLVGCPFADRCDHVMEVCSRRDPALLPLAEDHDVACYLHHEPAAPEQVATR